MTRIPSGTRVHLPLYACAMILACAGPGSASLFYQNDFESPVGPEWSTAERDTTPLAGRVFLGRFSGSSATLSLSGLPPHSELSVSLELFVLLTWDGNYSDIPGIGPDIWDLSVAGGPTLLHTTFSNGPPGTNQPSQAYPGTYPGAANTYMSGADETYSLGYFRNTTEGVMDAVYDLSFVFPHVGSSVQLVFSTSSLQGLPDEAWGIDNVVVGTGQSTAVEPLSDSRTAMARLLPAAPNPAESFTRLAFELAREDRVTLSVYSVSGSLVRILGVPGQTWGAGRHDVHWDGRDDGGRRLPTGPYFVMLRAGPERITEKVTLLR